MVRSTSFCRGPLQMTKKSVTSCLSPVPGVTLGDAGTFILQQILETQLCQRSPILNTRGVGRPFSGLRFPERRRFLNHCLLRLLETWIRHQSLQSHNVRRHISHISLQLLFTKPVVRTRNWKTRVNTKMITVAFHKGLTVASVCLPWCPQVPWILCELTGLSVFSNLVFMDIKNWFLCVLECFFYALLSNLKCLKVWNLFWGDGTKAGSCWIGCIDCCFLTQG